MLGLGFWELVIIGLIALIVIGPERLPDFAKSVAKFLNEMKRTVTDLKSNFDDEKDIFKDNIDQLQKLKKELQALPEFDSSSRDSSPLPLEEEHHHEAQISLPLDDLDSLPIEELLNEHKLEEIHSEEAKLEKDSLETSEITKDKV